MDSAYIRGQEDLVSMALGGYRLIEIQNNLTVILAIELLVASVNSLGFQKSPARTGTIFNLISKICDFGIGDRVLKTEIDRIADMITKKRLSQQWKNFKIE